MIFRKTEEKYFCARDWTGFQCNCPTGKSVARHSCETRCGTRVSGKERAGAHGLACVTWAAGAPRRCAGWSWVTARPSTNAGADRAPSRADNNIDGHSNMDCHGNSRIHNSSPDHRSSHSSHSTHVVVALLSRRRSAQTPSLRKLPLPRFPDGSAGGGGRH